jgi:hypothetical protein
MTDTLQIMDSFINTYIPVISTLVVAVATIVLVWLTSKYVRLTKQMVDDMKRSKEPAINIDFEIPDGSLRFIINNTGLSPAKNIRFTVVKDVDWLRGGNKENGIAGLAPINHGISYLVPGRTLKYLLGYPDWRTNEKQDLLISIHVEFENIEGRTFTHDIDIDMSQFKGVLFESFKDSNLAVADAIKETEQRRQTEKNVHRMFSRRQAKKQCPVCNELIMTNATKCIHCGEWIKNEEGQKKGKKKDKERKTKKIRFNL